MYKVHYCQNDNLCPVSKKRIFWPLTNIRGSVVSEALCESEDILFSCAMMILDFLKTGCWMLDFSKNTMWKTTTFLESTWKMSSTVSFFYFSRTLLSGGKMDLKIGKSFSKTTFFRCSASTEMIQWS